MWNNLTSSGHDISWTEHNICICYDASKYKECIQYIVYRITWKILHGS
jgi:hypothetical protein